MTRAASTEQIGWESRETDCPLSFLTLNGSYATVWHHELNPYQVAHHTVAIKAPCLHVQGLYEHSTGTKRDHSWLDVMRMSTLDIASLTSAHYKMASLARYGSSAPGHIRTI